VIENFASLDRGIGNDGIEDRPRAGPGRPGEPMRGLLDIASHDVELCVGPDPFSLEDEDLVGRATQAVRPVDEVEWVDGSHLPCVVNSDDRHAEFVRECLEATERRVVLVVERPGFAVPAPRRPSRDTGP
jgi:hypothetical protein